MDKTEPERVIVQPPPPPYKGFKVKQTPLIVAVGVACALGTALFVVSLLGGMWINNLKGQVAQSGSGSTNESGGGYEKTIDIKVTIDSEDKSETVNLDKIKNEEVDLQYDKQGELEYVSVMDYNTNIYGSYSVADQECYIYHAEDHKYDSVDDLLDKVQDEEAQGNYNSSRMDYVMDKKPISDHSILPHNLQPYCEGKDTYWLRSMDTCGAEEDHNRQKRGLWYCWGGYWRCIGWCYGCRCPRSSYCGYWRYWVCVGGLLRWG